MEFIIALPILIGLLIFAIYGSYILWRAIGRERIIQERAKYWHDADQNGNYPLFYDRQDDRALRTRPGNPPYPQPRQDVTPSYPPTKKQPPRPIIITTPRPPELESGERSVEPNVQDEPPVQELLRQAKERGDAKAASIFAYTGVTKGGGKVWKEWSDVWEHL